ncbi:aminotransferase class V-fold PLP-dependent enzyme [Shewanella aestuarii]|uniref:Cysteine desulfurase n=1 Tax=Shewanella aestuarii TaxID=1028752 RepID=A0A6G9QGT7_9GAMM|nr:cysteine desulfurase [Shewanella aestuarii]QIR13682.1 cysteine desulfurase [Shewanella aestuarii]
MTTSNLFDHNAIRSQFPVLSQMLGDNPLCYLDTAATSQKPQMVLDAMTAYYQFDNANVHRAAHQLAARATIQYEKVRQQVQDFINSPSLQQVIFTHGTTESINMVAHGLMDTLSKDDIILVDGAAHHANIVPWQALAKRVGAKVVAIPLDANGRIDQTAYDELLLTQPKLVALAHVSNALGTVNPINAMVAKAKAIGALTLVDGAQAVAHLAVDVQTLDCDYYVFSGHKMYGPTGIGILYGKLAALNMLTPMLTGGEMIKTVSFDGTTYGELPNRLEAGTPAIAEVMGFGAAITFLNSLPQAQLRQHEQQLLRYLQQQLSQLGDITLYGVDGGKESHENIGSVAFNLANEHHQDVSILLDQQGIAIRSGHHCAMPLMQSLQIKGCCRASIGLYSNKQDIDRFISAMAQVKSILL